MRDKKDATEFIRSIDRSHHANIRVVIPPVIDEHLKSPNKIKFVKEGRNVIISSVKEKD